MQYMVKKKKERRDKITRRVPQRDAEHNISPKELRFSCAFFSFTPDAPVCAVPTAIPESGILCKRDGACNAFVKDVSRSLLLFLPYFAAFGNVAATRERERKKKGEVT